MVEAIRSGDMAKAGLLLSASHESLRRDFEVSCEELDFLVEGFAGGCERGKRQAGAKALRALHGGCAEVSELNRIAVEGGFDPSVRVCFERHAVIEADGKHSCRGLWPSLFLGRAHAGPPV